MAGVLHSAKLERADLTRSLGLTRLGLAFAWDDGGAAENNHMLPIASQHLDMKHSPMG